MLNFTFDTDEAERLLSTKLKSLSSPERFCLIWAKLAADEARRNARAKGGKHFWVGLAQQIKTGRVPGGGEIRVEHVAAAQKEYGGPIRARNKRCLTIPIHELAYGRRVSEQTEELFSITSKAGNRILGFDDGEKFVGLYAATKPQRPDPFMPTPERMLEIGEKELEYELGRKI